MSFRNVSKFRRDERRDGELVSNCCICIHQQYLSRKLFSDAFIKQRTPISRETKRAHASPPVSTSISCDKRNRVKFSVENHTETIRPYTSTPRDGRITPTRPYPVIPRTRVKGKSEGVVESRGFSVRDEKSFFFVLFFPIIRNTEKNFVLAQSSSSSPPYHQTYPNKLE